MNEQIMGAIAGLAIAAIIIAILVFIFRWLWNSTMPEVFGVKELTFGQAIKILILASILFGGHRVANIPGQMSADTPPAATQSE